MILGAILLSAAAASPLAAQVGLGLVPMRLEMQFGDARQHSGTLNLSNDSASSVRVRAEILDFFIDQTQTPQFERNVPQEAKFSCRPWLSLNPMEMELPPGGSVAVRYTIRLPEGVAPGSYHCAAGFTTLPTAEQASGIGIRTAVRMVTAFYAVVGTPKIEGELKSVELEYVPAKDQPEWRAVVTVDNRGTMHFRPTGSVAVLDSNGKEVETVSLVPVPVLPQREQRFLCPLKDLQPDAHYTLRARVDLGTPEIQEGTATVVAHVPSP